MQFESDGGTVTLTIDEHDLSRIMLGLYHLANDTSPIIDPEGQAYHLTEGGMRELVAFYNELDEYATDFYLARSSGIDSEVIQNG